MKSCQELKRKWKEEKKDNWFFLFICLIHLHFFIHRGPLVIIGEYKQKKVGHLTLIRLQRHTL